MGVLWLVRQASWNGRICTFDFLFLQAMHAVLTHRLLAAAAPAVISLSFGFERCFDLAWLLDSLVSASWGLSASRGVLSPDSSSCKVEFAISSEKGKKG